MKKVIVNDDIDEELQKEELSHDKQEKAPCENQEERRGEQANTDK